MKLFTARGFDNVAVKDICAAVGIPRSSFYLAFADKAGLFGLLENFNDWLIQLTTNCQKQGIVRNKTTSTALVPMQLNLAKAYLFEWVYANGAFPLQDTVRRGIETFLDVAPEYRKQPPI